MITVSFIFKLRGDFAAHAKTGTSRRFPFPCRVDRVTLSFGKYYDINIFILFKISSFYCKQRSPIEIYVQIIKIS